MRYTLTQYLLFLAVIGSSYGYLASQQPLGRMANLAPEYSPPYFGRCPVGRFWVCTKHLTEVICWCRPVSDAPPYAATLPQAGVVDQLLEQAKSVTTLDVYTEIQPGNNNTRVGLFELHCDGNEYVLCIHRVCGFECGCYDDADLVDMGLLKSGCQERRQDTGKPAREIQDHRYNESQEGDFGFQKFHRPIPCDECCWQVTEWRWTCRCC